ncbi:MAG: hypothetical protein CM1200mP27_13320 [Chloroflexota bacterium]|nr:MAG: hypothetical protein CM1200mP27_13320 [Chloroflexota bacterium]
MHTNMTADIDVDPPEEVRIYVFASTQHALPSFPPGIMTRMVTMANILSTSWITELSLGQL